jgi:hypothetical protein
MGKVAGKQNEVGSRGKSVDHLHRALKRLGAQRFGRAVGSHVGIAELDEGKRGGLLAVLLAEIAHHLASFADGRHGQRRVQHPDAKRSTGYLHK